MKGERKTRKSPFLQPENVEGCLVAMRRTEEPAPVKVEEIVRPKLDVAETLEEAKVYFPHLSGGIHETFGSTRRRETETSAVGNATEEASVVEERGEGGDLGIVNRTFFGGRRTTVELDGGRGEEEPR
jgi:hypothetical protein